MDRITEAILNSADLQEEEEIVENKKDKLLDAFLTILTILKENSLGGDNFSLLMNRLDSLEKNVRPKVFSMQG